MQKKRVIAFVCSGRYQNFLLNVLHEEHDLVGIVVQETHLDNKSFAQKLWSYRFPLKSLKWLLARLFLPFFERKSQKKLILDEPRFARWSSFERELPCLVVENINDDPVEQFVATHNPECICVNGTNLIKRRLLDYFGDIGVPLLNLHTGLSPYSRGGNCNLFMLLEKKPELIGGTIHFIDSGIDSGRILYTFRPQVQAEDPFEYIDGKVFLEGMIALSKAISIVLDGRSSGVKQWEDGKLFLKRTGYSYEVFDRLRANYLIRRGVIRNYLDDQLERDKGVRLIGTKSDFS